jgi:hypothetical protein
LLAKGKLKLVAKVACLQKRLVILNALLRDNQLWQVRFSPVAGQVSQSTQRTSQPSYCHACLECTTFFSMPLDFQDNRYKSGDRDGDRIV